MICRHAAFLLFSSSMSGPRFDILSRKALQTRHALRVLLQSHLYQRYTFQPIASRLVNIILQTPQKESRRRAISIARSGWALRTKRVVRIRSSCSGKWAHTGLFCVALGLPPVANFGYSRKHAACLADNTPYGAFAYRWSESKSRCDDKSSSGS